MTSTAPANCVSQSHKPPVPGTIHGTFNNPYSDTPPTRTLYCTTCANTIEAIGSFTPDPPENKV